MNANKRPVFEAKHRLIRASVFKNTTKEGQTYFNTQLVRRYKSGESEWSNFSHFAGEEDLQHIVDTQRPIPPEVIPVVPSGSLPIR